MHCNQLGVGTMTPCNQTKPSPQNRGSYRHVCRKKNISFVFGERYNKESSQDQLELTNEMEYSQKNNTPVLHVAMLPFLASGHQISFLQLANKLAKRGHKVSFFLNPKSKPKLESHNHHPHLITLIPLQIPHIDGLPVGTESMAEVGRAKVLLFLTVVDNMADHFEPILRSLKPDIIFYDFFHWIPAVARPLGIKSVVYLSSDTLTIAYFFLPARRLQFPKGENLDETKLTQPPPDFPESAINLQLFEARASLGYYRVFISGLTLFEFLWKIVEECNLWCLATCQEMDGPFFDCLEVHFKKQPVLTGPVLDFYADCTVLEEKWDSWLCGFKTGSVVYCALGSECILQKEEFQELLLGLELTGLPFLAALKPPSGAKTIEEALPEGFQNRVKERGMVYDGWVPQQSILKHHAVGCFVCHGGAASSWEGMVNKCQLVLLPQAAEQYLSARRMSIHLKLAVEIERREEDGWYSRESVCKAIKSVMDEENQVGMEVRSNKSKWRDFLLDENKMSSHIDRLAEKLQDLVQ